MLRYGLLLLLVSALALANQEQSYKGYYVYQLKPTTEAQVKLLLELSQQGYDFTRLSRKDARVVVSPEQRSSFQLLLQEQGLSYELLSDNLEAVLAKEFAQRSLVPLKQSGKGRLSTERYYNYEEIMNYIADLAARYPKRVYVRTVGWSYEQRALKTITITNGDGRANKKVVFVDGCFHAREWISPASVLYIIDQLVEHFEENAYLLKDFDWIIQPLVNPDGYEHTQTGSTARMFRKTRQPYRQLGLTCYGADPNRNFDYHWNEEGASSSPCVDNYAGPHPFSEREAIVIRDLINSLADRGVMYLSMHSYGNYLLYPWGWTSDLPNTWQDQDDVARAGGDAIKAATGTDYTVGSATNVLYIASGISIDYALWAGFNISITMELSGGGLLGFNPPESSIEEYVSETWIGVRAMAEKLIEKY
ncbi:carboxypeptidase B-like [Drosophila busckii]|uniref:carboxypeptidase B-like n=1 Tax=Drosophila busckii TaxID=30019 RepID=UPI00083F0389|nr:carboxypeptidase B-like [Drosophila busckii]